MPKFLETEQAAKDLKIALEPVVKMIDDLAKSIVSVDSVIKKQAKTTEDLTDKEKHIFEIKEVLKKAEQFKNINPEDLIKKYSQKPKKELTFEQTLRIFKAIPIEEWSEV